MVLLLSLFFIISSVPSIVWSTTALWSGITSISHEPPQHNIVKLGTVDMNMVETSPVVWKGRLMRLESVKPAKSYTGNNRPDGKSYFRFRDVSTGLVTPDFAVGYAFGSAFVVDETMYVYGTIPDVPPVGPDRYGGGNHISVFWSRDLNCWNSTDWAVTFPNGTNTTLRCFNNDVWKGIFNGKSAYIMPIEFGDPPSVVGARFTMGFAVTYEDTPEAGWTLLDLEKYIYTKKYYSACPAIWYEPETQYWYMVYLRTWPKPYSRYAEDVVRSKDLLSWEEGSSNPLLWHSLADGVMSTEPDAGANNATATATHAKECVGTLSADIDASDIDFIEITEECIGCPSSPSVYINYNWGSQTGLCEFLAAAVYNGTMRQFLEEVYQ